MKIKILLILLFGNQLYFTQSTLLKEGNIVQKNYFTTIPFEIFYDKMIIPVTIDGKNYRFMFDTGAPNTLNSDVFKAQKKIGSINISDSNNKTKSLMIVDVPTFTIDQLDFSNFKFLEYDFSINNVFNCLKIDGIIGSNSFKNSIIKIDYNGRKIIVTDKIDNFSPRVKAQKMKLIGDQKSPFLEITLSGKDKVYEDVLLDTGYNKLYVQSERAFKIFSKKQVYENVITRKGILSISLFGSDDATDKSIFTVPNFGVKNLNFKNIVAYTSNDRNSKIGTEFLKYGTIILDFTKSKYYFESETDTITLNDNYPLFTPSYQDGHLIVGMVINETLQKEITIGDKIISIDDKEVNSKNCDEIFHFEYPKTKFTVSSKNGLKEILISNYQ